MPLITSRLEEQEQEELDRIREGYARLAPAALGSSAADTGVPDVR